MSKSKCTVSNSTPNAAPEKKSGFGRNLAGFSGQALVLLTGTTAVAPFRAAELALSMTGQLVQLVGVTIETAGLGISWVGMQTGRPGDVVGQAARKANERMRAWRTQTQPQELEPYIPITCGPRRDTTRKVEEMKWKAKEYLAAAKQAFVDATSRDGEAPAEAAPDPAQN